MSDSDISSLNFSAFTRTTGRTIVTGQVVQRTCNFQTRQGEPIIPRPAPISVNYPRLPDNYGNVSQPLAVIFLANTSQRSIKNAPAPTRTSRESVYRVMEIENDNNSNSQFSDLDDDNETNFFYHIT